MDDQKKDPQSPGVETIEADGSPALNEVKADESEHLDDGELPGFNEDMLAQAQAMMAKLERADQLEQENNDLKHKLGRLASDFEGYRTRTHQEAQEAEARGLAKAAEALMPVYDDIARALTMASDDPAKLIPGMEAVQNKVLHIFAELGLEATGREGETFDPQWHEAIQVMPGEQDDVIVQVYELGFRMGERSVRPARVVVSKKG